MFRSERSILIYKARHDVFKFLVNPADITLWRFDVSSTKFLSLPLRVGDTWEGTDSTDSKISVTRVVNIVPNKQIVLTAMNGGMCLPRQKLVFSEEKETMLTVKVSAKSDGFSQWMELTSSQDYSLKWENHFFCLKSMLESEIKLIADAE